MFRKGYKFKVVSVAKKAQAQQAQIKALAAIQILAAERRRAYNESPHLCLYCQAPILVPDEACSSEFHCIKKKKFCSQSCGAKYSNRVLRVPRRKKVRTCPECGLTHNDPRRKSERCQGCIHAPRVSALSSRKKSECRIQDIRGHARDVLFKVKERKCEICGYSVRVDCCHVKAVKEFTKDALLSEINKLENLKALCPNHHVELDLGLLKISVGV